MLIIHAGKHNIKQSISHLNFLRVNTINCTHTHIHINSK